MGKLKKLSLKKETISSLNSLEMRYLNGGGVESTDWEYTYDEYGNVVDKSCILEEVVVTPAPLTTPTPVLSGLSW